MSEKDQIEFEPPEWDEQSQTWVWPPKPVKRVTQLTIRNLATIVRTVAAGPIEDEKKGRAVAVLAARAGLEYSNSHLNKMVNALEKLGFVKRDQQNRRTGNVHPLRTYRLELDVPVEQLPPELQPEPPKPRFLSDSFPPGAPEEAWAEAAAPANAFPTAEQIVDELIRRATEGGGDPEELELRGQQIEKLREVVSKQNGELAKLRDDVKVLRSANDRLTEENRTIQRNLDIVVRQAKDWADNAPASKREDQQRKISQMMRRIERES